MYHNRCDIFKIKGHRLSKFLFILSCVLIYPIFQRLEYEQYLANSIETLLSYRHNILRTIKFRQATLATLFHKYERYFNHGIKMIFKNIISTNFTFRTMYTLEFQIIGLFQVVTRDNKMPNKLILEFENALSLSTNEIGNLTHAYYSIYRKTQVKLSGIPWRIYLKVFDFDKIELYTN